MPKFTPTPISRNLISPPPLNPSKFTLSSSFALQKFSSPSSRYFGDTYLSFDPTLFPLSLSEASLGLWDIDFDAVCALCGGVLAKRGSLFSSQQTLASLLSLLLCRGRRRGGWRVCALLAAQQWSSLTGLLWSWRGRLLLVLWRWEWWNMTREQCAKGRRKDRRQWENAILEMLKRFYLFRQVWQTGLWQRHYASADCFLLKLEITFSSFRW